MCPCLQQPAPDAKVHVVADPPPKMPVELAYDAQQDAKTQVRTSISYYAPQPAQLADSKAVTAQEVIVKLQGLQASTDAQPAGPVPSLRDSLLRMKEMIREEAAAKPSDQATKTAASGEVRAAPGVAHHLHSHQPQLPLPLAAVLLM